MRWKYSWKYLSNDNDSSKKWWFEESKNYENWKKEKIVAIQKIEKSQDLGQFKINRKFKKPKKIIYKLILKKIKNHKKNFEWIQSIGTSNMFHKLPRPFVMFRKVGYTEFGSGQVKSCDIKL